MAGFASLDDMTSELSAGKFWRQDWTKQSASTAAWATGSFNDCNSLTGSPTAGTYPGTTLVAQTPSDRNGAGVLGAGPGIWHGGGVSPDTKHLLNIGYYSSVATTAPSLAVLVDMVMYYPLLSNLVTTQQTMVNSNTFTASSSSGLLLTHANDFGSATHYTTVKFTTTTTLPTGLNTSDLFYLVRQSATTSKVATSHANAVAGTFIAFTDAGTGTHTLTVTPSRYADGAGLRAYVVEQARTGSTAAGTPVMDQTASTGTEYIDDLDATKQFGAAVSYVTGAANTPLVSRIVHSGVAANNFGPFLPFAAGGKGIKRLRTYKLSTAYTTATTEQVAVVLCKPLATIPIITAGAAGERNLLMQLPSLPRIYDGACLNVLIFNGNASGIAASTPLMGYCEFGWG
jgi:hypothetical protein